MTTQEKITQLQKDIETLQRTIDSPSFEKETPHIQTKLKDRVAELKGKLDSEKKILDIEQEGDARRAQNAGKQKPEKKPKEKAAAKSSDAPAAKKASPKAEAEYTLEYEGKTYTEKDVDFCEKLLEANRRTREARKTSARKSDVKSGLLKAEDQMANAVQNVVDEKVTDAATKVPHKTAKQVVTILLEDLEKGLHEVEVEKHKKEVIKEALKMIKEALAEVE